MVTNLDIVETAENSGLLGTPYSKLDCQAFVEEVLWKAGLKTINFRGSNHMWRDLVYDRTKISDSDGMLPPGTLVFNVKFDGGEVKRGYHDDMGNAVHVGIAMGGSVIMHSTKGGVQYGSTKSFTDYAYIKDVDYVNIDIDDDPDSDGEDQKAIVKALFERISDIISNLTYRLEELEDMINDEY